MPFVYDNQQRIRELRGRVRGGITVVLDCPFEADGMRKLIRLASELPGDPLTNAYHTIGESGAALSEWPGWAAVPDSGEPDFSEGGTHSPVEELQAALTLAARLWMEQGEDVDQLALAMILPKPGRRSLFLDTKRPTLLLDHGSVRARLASGGARLRQFGVALFPKARSRRQANLVEALRARGGGRALPRLESVLPVDLHDKQAVIVFLHGLMSTDAGTFDRLIEQIERHPLLSKVYLAGWPHDTLTNIEVNAEDLAALIEDRLGASGLPVLFVCHSRGGLVARATAVELCGTDLRWQNRLRGAVTFGTPHEGAELAEIGDELLGKVMLLKSISQTGRVIPLVDALWAVHNRKKIEGITDLRPRSNGGKFLRDLRKAESKQVGRVNGRALPLLVVGGRARPQGGAGWLSRRFFGGESNDLVVALSSSMPASFQPSLETETDHFSYFSTAEIAKAHTSEVLGFIAAALGLSAAAPAQPKIDLSVAEPSAAAVVSESNRYRKKPTSVTSSPTS